MEVLAKSTPWLKKLYMGYIKKGGSGVYQWIDLVFGVLKYKKKNVEVERGWNASMKSFSTQGTKIQKKFRGWWYALFCQKVF